MDRYTVKVRDGYATPLAAGLWLAKPVADQLLASPGGVARFASGLAARSLTCHTLNAFPFGDFHSTRVKENVYLPDWTTPQRLAYTQQCGRILAELLPDGAEGSISTLPLGFKGFEHPPAFLDAAAARLIEAARQLSQIEARTGKRIRLGIEPEPLCVLETTPETIAFFSHLRELAARAGAEEIVRKHIGVCFDVCHQAVEFEDVAASIRALSAADIRINKVHISCALELDNPSENPEGRAALARYVEPRYLHQTMARTAAGHVARVQDLNEDLITSPPADFRSAPAWRVHFHVPVDAERMGPLATTRHALREALSAVAALDYPPHLEVETYTWEVLPDSGPADLVTGLTRELLATRHLLDAIAMMMGDEK
ncbi:MAG: Xylose isomerase-like barrel [Phycisphaerales bacterium]|nr:Xylose isomerase-like barrel [Phycisphaerales bacterium]